MAIGTAIALAGASIIGTAYSANKASKAAQAGIDAQRQAASDANDMSAERFEWDKWVYENDIAPANKANQELQLLLAEDYLDTSATNKEFAKEQQDEYRTVYQPIERKMAEEAVGYDSEENVARRSGTAAANVNQQFSNAIGQRARTAGRYGLSSSSFSNQLSKDTLAQAATASGAATGAAFETKDKAIALRSGVANFGRGMPNSAAQAFGISNQANAGASSTSNSSSNATLGGAEFMDRAYGSRIGGIGNYGDTMGAAGRAEAGMWGSITQGLGGLSGALINANGGWGGVGNAMLGLFKPGG